MSVTTALSPTLGYIILPAVNATLMVPLLSNVKGFLPLPGFTVVPIEPANVSDALPATPLVTLREEAKLPWVMYHKPQEYPTVPVLVCPIVKNPVSIQS